jgi:hypothetical protein
VNSARLHDEFVRLSRLIDNGVDALRKAGEDVAQAEHDYRLARAIAWPKTDGTAKEREDQVNALTAPDRRARDLAESHRLAVLEALRSRRQQLSALQTLSNADREEAAFARTGPGMQP